MFFFKDYLLVELYISLDAIRPKFFLWNTNTNNTDCVCVCVCVCGGGGGGSEALKKGRGWNMMQRQVFLRGDGGWI